MANQQQTVAFHTLGCKLNYSETSAIGRQFNNAGFKTIAFENAADVYVINTCSVTDNADKKCRYTIRKALQKNEQAFIVIVGCYAQLKPKEISEIEGVDLVLGAAEKFNILEHIQNLTKKDKGEFISSDVCEADVFVNAFSVGERTRSFLKVQDGCDYNCAFCTIPLARGNSRSSTIEKVVHDAHAIADMGIKEIVLTGVNIGDFGKGKNGGRRPNEAFIDLVKALDEVEGIERFRISSIEPNLLTNEVIEFVAQSQRFMPHFHIPLQSGNNEILGKMRRRYRCELYADRVATIKKLMPHCCIGVDVIIGFPGETEGHFLSTYDFLNELDVSYLHVFTYSERPNTLAIEMEGIVPQNERKKRSKMLRILSQKKKRFFYNQFVGQQKPVLWETDRHEQMMHGFTDNYVKVSTPYNEGLINTISHVTIGDVQSDLVCESQLLEKIYA